MATIPAYSVVLWELLPNYPVPGPQLGPAVPDGFTWVVRSVVLYNFDPRGPGRGIGRLVLDTDTQPIFATPLNGTAGGVLYELHDARKVLESGQQLAFNTDDPNWSLRVTGFSFTA